METNPISDFTGQNGWGDFLDNLPARSYRVSEIARFTRVRFISERGFPVKELSYAMGELADGTPVRVQIDGGHFGKTTYRSEMAAYVKAEGGSRKLQQQCWDEVIYSVMYA